MEQANFQRQLVRARTFTALGLEWDQLCTSGLYRRQLRLWRELEPGLGSCWDGVDVVDLGSSSDQSEACRVLEALARLTQGDHGHDRVDPALAARSALQILLPRLGSLCGRGNGWVDFDELVGLVLSFAWEALFSLHPDFRCDSKGRRSDVRCSTPYDFRLWSTIKSRVGAARKKRIVSFQAELSGVDLDDLSEVVDRDDSWSDDSVEVLSLWVSQVASVSKDKADLVVLSRAGYATVKQLAGAGSAEAAWKSRQRSEAKLKASLAA